MKLSEESIKKIGELIRSEVTIQLEKRQVKFDKSDVDDIVNQVKSKIAPPKLDQQEIVKTLLSEVKTNDEEKRADFYRDEIFSTEIKSALSKQVLDQIEIPKDGEQGVKGEQGEPGKDAQPLPLTDRDKKEIADLIDVSKLVKDRKQDIIELVKQLKSGKIKLPSHAGIDVKEIIAEFNKIIGHENWQDRGLLISNDGVEVSTRPDENYSTDDNIDVTSTDNPGEDRVDTVISISDNPNFDSILYNENAGSPPNENAGRAWWNNNELALNISSGVGPVLQVGQEVYILIYNDTVSQIDNSTPLRPKAATVVSGLVVPTVEEARSDVFSGAEGTLIISTMDIPPSTVGLATRFGRVRGGDTSGFSPGDGLWIAPTGGLQNTRPSFPNYDISVGGVLFSDPDDGEIFVSFTRDVFDTTINFWNGVFRESIDFLVSSNGTTITGTLQPSNGHPDMTMMFSDGFTMLDTSPPLAITLTPGTDNIPQANFVYILQSTKVLTISTSDWPTAEHIKVASVLLRTAATTQTDGALRNQNWNDHIQSTNTNQGHLSHIGEKLRQFESQWRSGIEGSATGFPTNFYVSTTAGVTYQLHKQTFVAQSMPTDDIHVVNNAANPYLTVTNLNGQTLDALGVTLANYSFSFVVWGVQNKTGETSHLMCNLPIGRYAKNNPGLAVSDALNYSVYSIPSEFQGVGFLIARFTLILESNGTTWSLYDTEDLRGKIPNTTAGGGAGGAGVTTLNGLTDYPAAHVAYGIPRVNAAGTAQDFTTLIKSGATQVAAGAVSGEFWRTSSHATLPDNVVLQGV